MVKGDEFLILASYVNSSSYRRKVVEVMEAVNPNTPTKIANEAGLRRNHISKILRELREHDLVVCINPEVRKGKLYRLTPLGLQIKKKLEGLNW